MKKHKIITKWKREILEEYHKKIRELKPRISDIPVFSSNRRANLSHIYHDAAADKTGLPSWIVSTIFRRLTCKEKGAFDQPGPRFGQVE